MRIGVAAHAVGGCGDTGFGPGRVVEGTSLTRCLAPPAASVSSTRTTNPLGVGGDVGVRHLDVQVVQADSRYGSKLSRQQDVRVVSLSTFTRHQVGWPDPSAEAPSTTGIRSRPGSGCTENDNRAVRPPRPSCSQCRRATASAPSRQRGRRDRARLLPLADAGNDERQPCRLKSVEPLLVQSAMRRHGRRGAHQHGIPDLVPDRAAQSRSTWLSTRRAGGSSVR